MSIFATRFWRRKRVAVLALALIAITLFLIIARRVQIESARYDRLQLGMTIEEVEDILGPEESSLTLSFNTTARWSSIGGTVYVNFDRHGIATAKLFSAYGIRKHQPKRLELPPFQTELEVHESEPERIASIVAPGGLSKAHATNAHRISANNNKYLRMPAGSKSFRIERGVRPA